MGERERERESVGARAVLRIAGRGCARGCVCERGVRVWCAFVIERASKWLRVHVYGREWARV